MDKFTNIIETFVNKMGYLNNEQLEGIIFYGSNQTGFSNSYSDLDLHIIFSNDLEQEVRGSILIDNIRIEYFEKSLKSMYDKSLNEFKNQGNAVVSMIVFGNVIVDINGNIAKLQDYISQLYSLPMPSIDIETAKEQIAIINNFFDDLINLISINDIYSTHIFHLTLERIKDFYFSYNALPGVSRTKALKVMQNDDYRNAIKKEKPPQEFIELYLKCLDEKLSIRERLPILCELFKYSTNDINFDKNNHRIILNKKKQ
ncbi:MAG: nucleotidyltransferase domain-containing protein [bacterium]|nr:nucleotidyltransferase domain-containing protein [bacterium]